MKDMVTTRARLESAIKKFHLYPETTANKTMLDAVEEMKPHVGFRALEGGNTSSASTETRPTGAGRHAVPVRVAHRRLRGGRPGRPASTRPTSSPKRGAASLAGLEEATKALTDVPRRPPGVRARGEAGRAAPFGPSPTARHPPHAEGRKATRRRRTASSPRSIAKRERLDGEITARVRARAGLPAPRRASSSTSRLAQAQSGVEAAAKRVGGDPGGLGLEVEPDRGPPRHARRAHGGRGRGAAAARGEGAARGLQQMKAGGGALGRLSAAIPRRSPASCGRSTRRSRRAARSSRRAPGTPVRRRAVGQRASGEPGSSRRSSSSRPTGSGCSARSARRSRTTTISSSRAERAKLALEAAHVQANEQMAIVDPPSVRRTRRRAGARTSALAGVGARVAARRWRTRRRASRWTTRWSTPTTSRHSVSCPMLVRRSPASRPRSRPRAHPGERPPSMQPREHAARTTPSSSVRGDRPAERGRALVRAVPVWAAPPDLRVLAMLGEIRRLRRRPRSASSGTVSRRFGAEGSGRSPSRARATARARRRSPRSSRSASARRSGPACSWSRPT